MKELLNIRVRELEIPIRLNCGKNIKNVRLSFNIDKGYLNISKPNFVSMTRLKKFIKENEEEIYNSYFKMLKLKEKRVIKKEINKRKWVTGEKLLLFGEKYEVCIIETNEKRLNDVEISLEDKKLYITIENGLNDENRRNTVIVLFKKFLKELTEKILHERLKYWSEKTNIAYNSVKVKYVKTRWGSCVKKTKSLNFSSRLCMFPMKVIDAVIVHELCHIIHPNHSKIYWSLVYKYIPDYKVCNKWIKENITKFEIE